MDKHEQVIWRLQGEIEMLSLACTALIESHPRAEQLKHYIRLRQAYDADRPDDSEIMKRINAGSRLIGDLLVSGLGTDPALRDLVRSPPRGTAPAEAPEPAPAARARMRHS